MGDTEHGDQATTRTAAERAALEKRVHVDLPRVAPRGHGDHPGRRPTAGPRGGRDTDTEFMLRNAGW